MRSPEPRRPSTARSGPGGSKSFAKEREILHGSANAPATTASASKSLAARGAKSVFQGASSRANNTARLAAHQITGMAKRGSGASAHQTTSADATAVAERAMGNG